MAKNEKKVCMITFHSAYNFGSMLQAYALQKTIKKIFMNCKIINYRLASQKNIYQLKQNINENNDQFINQKKARELLFETFLQKMDLTSETNEWDETLSVMNNFDILISGSDQILNLDIGELKNIDFNYSRPYLLDVKNKIKVSYASSFTNISEAKFRILANHLKTFNFISVREHSSIFKLKQYVDKQIEYVCDPVFLLSKDEWISAFNLKKREQNKPYILFYTLYNYEHTLKKLKILINKLSQKDIEIHVIAPFCEKMLENIDSRIKHIIPVGPIEFLEELYNSIFVIPESFHGAAFSVIFNKRFICPCGDTGPELRKVELLKHFCLNNQLRPNFYTIELKDIFEDFNYDTANSIIDKFRKESMSYLEKINRVC